MRVYRAYLKTKHNIAFSYSYKRPAPMQGFEMLTILWCDCSRGICPVQVAPAFAQLLAPYNVRFVRGSVASVEPQETLGNGSTASGASLVLTIAP